MAAHRYWRWVSHFPATLLSFSYAVCCNIKFYDATDTEITGGTISASSEYSSSYLASNARNGSTANYWCSTTGYGPAHNAYLQIDFGAGNEQDVRKFSIQAPNSGDSQYTACAHEMQYSDDGVSWTTVRRFTNGSWTAAQTRTFDLSPTVTDTASKWRILIKAAGSNNWTEVAELTWYDASLAAVTGGTISANTAWDLSTYAASKARDGDAGTYWSSYNGINSKVNAALAVDWDTASKKMARVRITPRSNWDNGPTVFYVENSTDGIGWDVVGDVYSTTWTSATAKDFDIESSGPPPDPTGRRRPVYVCS